MRVLSFISPSSSSLRTSHPSPVTTSLLNHLSSLSPYLPYRGTFALQTSLISHCIESRSSNQHPPPPDTLITLEHSPVYTLGRRADVQNLLFKQDPKTSSYLRRRTSAPNSNSNPTKIQQTNPANLGIGKCGGRDYHVEYNDVITSDPGYAEGSDSFLLRHPVNSALLVRVDRGGDVTYHGPGQITVYPIVDLNGEGMKKDLHWYLGRVEDVVIGTMGDMGLKGERDDRGTGVWVGGKKISQVGIGCTGWVTKHGFAINVKRECMSYFDEIVPCGIERNEGGVVCLEEALGREVDMGEVDDIVRKNFKEVFNVEYC